MGVDVAGLRSSLTSARSEAGGFPAPDEAAHVALDGMRDLGVPDRSAPAGRSVPRVLTATTCADPRSGIVWCSFDPRVLRSDIGVPVHGDRAAVRDPVLCLNPDPAAELARIVDHLQLRLEVRTARVARVAALQ